MGTVRARLLQTCFIWALAVPLAAEKFSCPPQTRFQGRAQRVELGEDLFLPVLTSSAPGRRNVVCELDVPVVVKHVHSGKYLRDVNGFLLLSDDRGASFRLKSTGSLPGTVHFESTTGWPQRHISDAQGMVQLLPAAPGDSQSWWLSESGGGHIHLLSFLAGQLSVIDESLEMAFAAGDASGEWVITKENGDDACPLVTPSTAIVTLPSTLVDTEQHHHDMGSVVHDMDHLKGSSLIVSLAASDVPCSAEQWAPTLPGRGHALRWSKSSDWTAGANPVQKNGPSSVQAIDAVVVWLANHYAGLEMIILTGVGEGGALGLRWAMLSLVGVNGVYTKADGRMLQVRTLIGGLTSWEYLDASRPAPKCTEDKQTTPCHRCDEFRPPEPGSRRRGQQVPGTCGQNYNKMPYGLSGLVGDSRIDKFSSLSAYVQLDFKNSAEFSELADKPFIEEYPLEVGMRFRSKDVRFFFNGMDSAPSDLRNALQAFSGRTTTSIDDRRSPGDACEVLLQGSSPLQRGLNYMGHLKEALSGYVPIFGVYEATEDASSHLSAWKSAFFQSWAFLERPGAAVQRPGKGGRWVQTPGRRCEDHGLLRLPEQCHTVASCKERCFADHYCSGFMMHADPADMQCWLFSKVNAGTCKMDGKFQLFSLEHTTTYFSSTTHFPSAAVHEFTSTSLRTSTPTTVTTTSPMLLWNAILPVREDKILTSVRLVCIAGIAAVIVGLICLLTCCATGGGARIAIEGGALAREPSAELFSRKPIPTTEC